MELRITVEEIYETIVDNENPDKLQMGESQTKPHSSFDEAIKPGQNQDSQVDEINEINHIYSVDAGGFSTLAESFAQSGVLGWYIVGASTIGSSHLKAHKACEDYHYCLGIENGWGVAVVSDGAGSAKNSRLGSTFVARQTAECLREEVLIRKWHAVTNLPSITEWNDTAISILEKVNMLLKNYCLEQNVEFNSVSCTLIAVIFSPFGLLITHVGDGRASYCNKQREWKPMLIPHKGAEANATVFITNEIIFKDMMISGVKLPECRVIDEVATAFALMTDGCERHSFFCSKFDQEINQWSDPNMPAEKFFNPLVENLRNLKAANETLTAANTKWVKFLNEGTPGLKSEPDDKTMILGILI